MANKIKAELQIGDKVKKVKGNPWHGFDVGDEDIVVSIPLSHQVGLKNHRGIHAIRSLELVREKSNQSIK